jgi:hypothetical protein
MGEGGRPRSPAAEMLEARAESALQTVRALREDRPISPEAASRRGSPTEDERLAYLCGRFGAFLEAQRHAEALSSVQVWCVEHEATGVSSVARVLLANAMYCNGDLEGAVEELKKCKVVRQGLTECDPLAMEVPPPSSSRHQNICPHNG